MIQTKPIKKERRKPIEFPPVRAYSQQSRFHNETVVTLSKDVDLRNVHLTIGDVDMLVDSRLWFKAGYHYGFIGRNGVGKSTLLNAIGNKTLIGFPENIRTLYVQQLDVLETSTTVLEAVLAADVERQKRVNDVQALEAAVADPVGLNSALDKYIARIATERITQAQTIATIRSGQRGKTARAIALKAEHNMLGEIRSQLYTKGKNDSDVAADVLTTLYAELDEMGASTAEARARAILADLDVSEEQQDSPVSFLSGGWRMRVALAKAMFLEPDIMLLDECTNHLDIGAIAWLQDYLKSLTDITIVCVSHDREFLNAISQEIIRFKDKKLTYHPGNYDEFEMAEGELRKKKERQVAALDRRRQQIEKSIEGFMKHARATNDSKVLGQVASRKKKLERLGPDKNEDGTRFKISYWAGYHDTMRRTIDLDKAEKEVDFSIPQPETMRNTAPLVTLNSVSFAYKAGSKDVTRNINLNILMGERVAVLGLNGCGKSTLVNVITRDLAPTKGTVEQHARLRIGHYTQHFVDELTNVQDSGLKMLMRDNPSVKEGEIRRWLGSFELSGDLAIRPICTLSGGQRARMAMALMLYSRPHLLLLDEVTNHLDMYAVEGLINAINEFEGAVVLISHDRHFVRETADDVYSLVDGNLTLLENGVDEYIQSIEGVDFN
ncbi:P-loop containing nucleoside triphosphate hydrolase protein [Linderina pennispora]|uniref:p-loop containing nucleoside triphosphate hydrolase protein n=1 Tax=Linderina pennispora TaxID=61395 RepID=A0A1Y1WAJ3_9FUNG|nr:P-loop containing nucleoside triphosphate hydrolase protein [Linderina pennispora]ORX70256.1 P-loop containing nucleoside triphosphate hydrolase protein [Linderina pennispora]